MPRPLEDLITTDDPAWSRVKVWINACPDLPAVFQPDERQREVVLQTLQVSLHSTLGALVWHTGGILLDDGWVRVLGSVSPRVPRSALTWAERLGWWSDHSQPPRGVVVAEDVLGGLFALNWSAIDPQTGLNEVFHFGADTLRWTPMGMGVTEFVQQLLTDELSAADAHLRWTGWREEVSTLTPEQGLHVWPPPWTREGKDVAECSRKPVPMHELVSFHFDMQRQLDGPARGDA